MRPPVAAEGWKPAQAVNEPSTSIFNDKLRRFRFKLEYTDVVTVEEAVAFMRRYSKRGNPEIIGAYPDADANLLVVIGPPEAEPAIRKSLATAIIEMQGIGGAGSLKVRKRKLQSRGRELIGNLAEIEALKVELLAGKTGNRDQKIKQLDDRLQYFEAELNVVKQQLQVVEKYMKRLNESPFRAEKPPASRNSTSPSRGRPQ